VQPEDLPTRAIYARLRNRARLLRNLGIGFFALIVLTLAFGAIPFFLAGDMAVSDARALFELRKIEAEHEARPRERPDDAAGEHADAAGAGATAPATPGDTAGTGAPKPPAPPPMERVAKAAERAGLAVGDETFAAAVIRITAVVLMIAVVFVLGGLYRYSMRLALYYDEKADALRLLEAGERQTEGKLAEISLAGTAEAVRRTRRGD
jgi:hypothetical protein